MWKLGEIIAVPKTGQPINEGSLYRPITLLFSVVKILEALILPFLKDSLALADHQHGCHYQKHNYGLSELSTRQFVHHPTKPDKNLRVVKRKIRMLVGSEEICFSVEDVLTAIKIAKPFTAIGLTNIMLKQLGMKGLEYLAEMNNLWKFQRCGSWGKSLLFPKLGNL